MSKRKYQEGDRIQFKDYLSPNGMYYDYRGKKGTIHSLDPYAGCIEKIKLDDGKIIPWVGYTVIRKLKDEEGLNKPTSPEKLMDNLNGEIQRMAEEKEKLETKIETAQIKRNFVERFKVQKFDMDVFNTYQILLAYNDYTDNVMNIETVSYNLLEVITTKILKNKFYHK